MRTNAYGNPLPKKNILLRIGQSHNKSYVVIYGYDGNYDRISDELLTALDKQLEEKYHGSQWKSFDYIEVLGEV